MSEKSVNDLMHEEKHDFASLVDIMKILRSENGCPWDREQDHKSIRANFIEETYEVVEAIDNQDSALLREELGDVLLQVIFHARISEEDGEFSINVVIHDICAKLIHRHPHIFGNVQADTSDVVLENWEKIKKEEKQRVGLSGTLQSIPPSLPALMRAQKVVKKCAKENLSPCSKDALNHLKASAVHLASEGTSENKDTLRKDLREILVSASVVAQANELDAEEILYDACGHITEVVRSAEQNGTVPLAKLSEDERESLVDRAFFQNNPQ